ncbi:30S ribosomal protein S20 [Desulfofundulus kuznetsovii DSM 6115]|uniref:Small ribosomal subunit protein bS20 n=1 Tax=Desulfofundulus kuznetsovii (strain DSM 6115 / VKM B-1805 / 17) TaxID=760568 RepID=A0AAU8PY57_DESK7|nr:30S ribosomal protein S20 [Desulfofundulus kuznetsovii DSM 6115]
MPNTKSAMKRVKVTRKRTLRNKQLKSALRTAIKKFERALTAGVNVEETRELLRRALRAIDKAVTKGIIHKNTAARKKSRLTRRFNRQAS